MSQKERIVTLQKQLKIAKAALTRISHGGVPAYHIAETALDEINRIQYTQVGIPAGEL